MGLASFNRMRRQQTENQGAGAGQEIKEPNTLPELKAWLTEHKVTYPANAKKDDLVALYEANKAGANDNSKPK